MNKQNIYAAAPGGSHVESRAMSRGVVQKLCVCKFGL